MEEFGDAKAARYFYYQALCQKYIYCRGPAYRGTPEWMQVILSASRLNLVFVVENISIVSL